MKKIIAVLFLLPMLAGVQAQDKTIHDANAVKRNLNGFHSVQVGGGVDLYISQGNEEAVAVSAARVEDRDKIITKVENGVLHIGMEPGNWGWSGGNRKLKAYVSVKTISELHAGGGSDVYMEGILRSDKLDLSFSGGSDGRGEIDAGSLTVTVSGGSDATLKGRAVSANITASGGSDFLGQGLAADNVRAEANGGSDVFITVNKELSARASGGSDVYYSGSGVMRDISASGGSEVKKRG
jgi:hypothetical protein